jgi:hypothetical protein
MFDLVIPAAVIDRLNRVTAAALKDQALIDKLLEFGLASTGAGTPESTGEFLRVASSSNPACRDMRGLRLVDRLRARAGHRREVVERSEAENVTSGVAKPLA